MRPTPMSRVLVGAHITFKKPLGGIHARSIKGSGFLAEAASAPWPVWKVVLEPSLLLVLPNVSPV